MSEGTLVNNDVSNVTPLLSGGQVGGETTRDISPGGNGKSPRPEDFSVPSGGGNSSSVRELFELKEQVRQLAQQNKKLDGEAQTLRQRNACLSDLLASADATAIKLQTVLKTPGWHKKHRSGPHCAGFA